MADLSQHTDEQLEALISDENRAHEEVREKFKARVAGIREEQAKRSAVKKFADMSDAERRVVAQLLGPAAIDPPANQVPAPKKK